MHGVALVAGGLATVFVLGLIPRAAVQDAASTPWPAVVSVGLILISSIVAIVAAARSRRSAMSLSLRLGADHPVMLNLRRENDSRTLWLWSAGVIFAPAALMPQPYPQYPTAAFALGMLYALLALLQILKLYRSNERYLRSLPAGALAAELAQMWSGQRMLLLVVLAVAIPGYLAPHLILGGPQSPLAWPPSPNLVIDIMAALYVLLLMVSGVVTYLQTRRWKGRNGGSQTVPAGGV